MSRLLAGEDMLVVLESGDGIEMETTRAGRKGEARELYKSFT
jgi:hypothetical protein